MRAKFQIDQLFEQAATNRLTTQKGGCTLDEVISALEKFRGKDVSIGLTNTETQFSIVIEVKNG